MVKRTAAKAKSGHMCHIVAATGPSVGIISGAICAANRGEVE
jgi:hypothetical protein